MILTISTTHQPATDLGYLLHKNPATVQVEQLGFGTAHVFYPEAGEARCMVALLVEVDAVALVRGRGPQGEGGQLKQYVNDRGYVANSFLSVALGRLFRTSMSGRSKERAELAQTAIPLEAYLPVVGARGGAELASRLFEPLGYLLETERPVLDVKFPEWGQSPYLSLKLKGTVRLQELLTHLYVLIPVLDNDKHYWVGQDEVEKLLAKGEGWLASHPEKNLIVSRYLKRQHNLTREALSRLLEEESPAELEEDEALAMDGADLIPAASEDLPSEEPGPEHPAGHVGGASAEEPKGEAPGAVEGGAGVQEGGEVVTPPPSPGLHQQRLEAVLASLAACGARRVVDLGCGEGKLLRLLLAHPQFETIVGMDVSSRSLEHARERLRWDTMSERKRSRINLIQGSLTYRDARLTGFDAAAVVEVIEHLDPARLPAFERVLFEFARPQNVVLTTPNAEYNALFPTLPAGEMRHGDHRFEWNRRELEAWAREVAQRFGYSVRFEPVGPLDPLLGAPTQMALFEREEGGAPREQEVKQS